MPSSRAYGVGERVLLGSPAAATKVLKSTGEDLTSLLSGAGDGFTGQPGDTLLVELRPFALTGAASIRPEVPTAAHGGVGGDIIDDGGGKGPQPLPAQQHGPVQGTVINPDAVVLNSSGILVEAPNGQGGWQTVTHYYPRERPDGAVLDTVGYDRLRLIFVGQHTIRFVGRLVPSSESIVAMKFPLVGAVHSRHGDVSQAVSVLGSLTTDLAPGDTVTLAFQNAPLEAGKVRDLFLFANGVYTSNLPAGSHPTDPEVPTRYALHQNRPNPFAASTTIRFDLPTASHIRVEIFDLLGRHVNTLADSRFEAGAFSVVWDHTSDAGGSVRPGIYLYRMSAGRFQAQQKMLLLP